LATLYLFDDVNAALVPSGAEYVAYYVDGEFGNYNAVKARFPNAVLVSIAVNPKDDADALDVEQFDATIGDVYFWLKRQLARGVERPVIYISGGRVDSMMLTMNANGFQRIEYRIWTAHYTGSPHICAPNTCGVVHSTVADWTQYTSRALGRSLDESLLSDVPVFTHPPVPAKPPAPKPVATQPELKEGDKGPAVERLQTQLCDSGIPGVRGIKVDGDFGPQTLVSVRNFQEDEFGPNGVDGIVGPETWARLDKVSPYKAPVAAPAAPAEAPVKAPEPVPVPPAVVPPPAPKPAPVKAPEPVPAPPVAVPPAVVTMAQAEDALKVLTEYVNERK
jgi:peptidoglycan hydrolase-like protein with peptidoglycan-binding domain